MDKSISIIESLCINLWTKQTYKTCDDYSLKMNLISVRAGPELLENDCTFQCTARLLGQQLFNTQFILRYEQ